jgi:hypothetical protein
LRLAGVSRTHALALFDEWGDGAGLVDRTAVPSTEAVLP